MLKLQKEIIIHLVESAVSNLTVGSGSVFNELSY